MRFSQNIILNTTPLTPSSTQKYWIYLYTSQLNTNLSSILLLNKVNPFLSTFKANILVNTYTTGLPSTANVLTSCSWDLFSIFFIRKERLYTKLKYSRVTQFDISSGAVAALFAGFIGFLISEKFGFELVDSGDFYFLFMYITFLVFSIKLLLRLNDSTGNSPSMFSFKWIFLFFNQLYLLFLNKFFNFCIFEYTAKWT